MTSGEGNGSSRDHDHTASVKLKPCPFCGGRPISSYCRDGRIIACQVCHAQAAPAFLGRADQPSAEDRAQANWNRRAAAPAAVRALTAMLEETEGTVTVANRGLGLARYQALEAVEAATGKPFMPSRRSA